MRSKVTTTHRRSGTMATKNEVIGELEKTYSDFHA